MPISAVVLEVKPGDEKLVAESISKIPCVDIQEIGIKHITVTTDTQRSEEDKALTSALERLPNVLSAQVVFTNMEDCIN